MRVRASFVTMEPELSLSKKVFCEHCSTYLCLKTFKAHQKLYYDDTTESWIKKLCTEEIDEWDDEDDDFHLLDPTSEPCDDNVRGMVNEIQPPPIVDFSEENIIQPQFEGT